MSRLTRLIPEETLVGYHLCYGTFPEWPMYEAQDMSVLVRMANHAVAESGRPVDWLHMAGPRYLRSEDERFFAPLRDLAARRRARVPGHRAAARRHPGLRRRHATASKFLDDFGVAMYCGFGRQPGRDGEETMREHARDRARRAMSFTRSDDGPLAVLTLDHGDLNLFDHSVFDSFVAHAAALAADPPRALLIEATGRVVSAGVDVHVFKDLEPESAGDIWAGLLGSIHQLEHLPARPSSPPTRSASPRPSRSRWPAISCSPPSRRSSASSSASSGSRRRWAARSAWPTAPAAPARASSSTPASCSTRARSRRGAS